MRFLYIFKLLAILVLLSDCGGNSDQKKKNNEIKVTVKEWVKLNNELFGNTSPAFYIAPIVSLDGKWLYLPTSGYAGNIAALEIGSDFPTNIQDKNKWSKLSFSTATGFDGTSGKAKFSDIGQIRTINPAHDGLLIAWKDTTGADRHGALYVQGKNLKLAWEATTHLPGFVATGIIDNFFSITKDSEQIPYVLAAFTAPPAKFLYTHNRFEAADLSTRAGFGPGMHAMGMAKFAQSKEKAFLVSQYGIAEIPIKDAGTATAFSTVAKNTPIYGSDAWSMGDPMTDNFNVSTVLVVSDILYIGLMAPHNNQGGVAILNSVDKTVIAPKPAIWNKISVRNLFVDDDNKVWAVTATELLEVLPDGNIGEKINAQIVQSKQVDASSKNKTDGYLGQMPSDNIFGVKNIAGSLLLTTDKEVYILKKKQI